MHKHPSYLNSLSNPLQNVSYIYVNCMWLWKAENTRWKKIRSFSGWFAVQSLSCVRLFATSWTAAHQAFLSFTISWSLLKLMSTESVMPSNHLILCPLLLLPSIFPSIRVFSSDSTLHIRWPKYWSFSISPPNEYSGLISFRFDWFHLFGGTLKSLLQQKYQFFGTRLSLQSISHIRTWPLEKP